MRVVTLVGSKAGQEITLPVLAARAMLADGRARVVGDPPADVPAPVVTDKVAARQDRSVPRHQRRAVR